MVETTWFTFRLTQKILVAVSRRRRTVEQSTIRGRVSPRVHIACNTHSFHSIIEVIKLSGETLRIFCDLFIGERPARHGEDIRKTRTLMWLIKNTRDFPQRPPLQWTSGSKISFSSSVETCRPVYQ